MQAVLAALPEFHGIKGDAEAAPESGQRHLAFGELLLELHELRLEGRAGGNARGLMGGPRSDLAVAGPGVKVLEHLGERELFSRAREDHLTLQVIPGKEHRDAGIVRDVMGLTGA